MGFDQDDSAIHNVDQYFPLTVGTPYHRYPVFHEILRSQGLQIFHANGGKLGKAVLNTFKGPRGCTFMVSKRAIYVEQGYY